MKRFVEGTDRGQATLFPECLADWIDEGNPVQVIDVLSKNLILQLWDLMGSRQRSPDGLRIIRQCC
jgi:hypothetical protein